MQQIASPARLENDLNAIAEFATRSPGSAAELSEHLADVYDAVFRVSLDRYEVDELRQSAPHLLQAIFDLRLRLRDQVATWHQQGFMSLNAQRALRSAFRVARYATDMLGELNLGYPELAPDDKTMRGFSGRDFNTLVNRAFKTGDDLPFRSGDLLLMRGMQHNSAAIARIGDVHSQFSHLAIIHIDENGGQWVVESLIEEGSIISPLEKALHHHLGRCVLFRHKDADLARRAAAKIYEVIKQSHSPGGTPILYDFSMELEGTKELFCSKLVREAFDLASNGEVVLPTFTTRFDMKNRDFVDRIGVTARETFAPSDIEVEPDFDIVAEWRDYRVTPRLRMQDFLMDKLFAWMDDYGYKFKEDFPIRLVGIFGHLSGHLSERSKALIADVVPKVPLNMSRSAIKAVAMLHKTAQPLLEDLLNLERECIASTRRPLHPREIYAHLERVREASNGRIGYLVSG